MRQNFRDCKAFADYGIQFSSTNNEAVKLFDAANQQVVYWYSEPSVGGFEGTLKNMLSADPEFVMGHIMSAVLSTDHAQNARTINLLNELSKKDSVLPWEREHVTAINAYAKGELYEAALVWEKLLLENPLDMVALRMAHMVYFRTGRSRELRDSLARVVPYWNASKDPLKTTVLGAYAFGLEEAGDYAEAERVGKEAVAMDPHDTYATHAVSHVFEMTGRPKDIVDWFKSSENDWKDQVVLAGHNYWHWGLAYIEQGNYAAALDIFDSQLEHFTKSEAQLDVTDAVQLLQRLKLEGVDVGERFKSTMELCKCHSASHHSLYSDSHTLMAAFGCGEEEYAGHLIKSLRDMFSDSEAEPTDYSLKVQKQLGVRVLEALAHYEKAEYAEAVEKLLTVRYELQTMGHSHAQRDIYNLYLIHAALRSPDRLHKALARNLLTERRCGRLDTTMIDRLQNMYLRSD